MRRLFFSRHDVYFYALKCRRLQPAVQVALRESQPAVTIKLMGAFERVLSKIQDHDLSSWAKDAVRALNRFFWIFGVMQGLAQDD